MNGGGNVGDQGPALGCSAIEVEADETNVHRSRSRDIDIEVESVVEVARGNMIRMINAWSGLCKSKGKILLNNERNRLRSPRNMWEFTQYLFRRRRTNSLCLDQA